jgi:hypothetical protein
LVKEVHIIKFKTEEINDIAELTDDQIIALKRTLRFKEK